MAETEKAEGVDEVLDDLEVPTAAYEWRYVDWEEGHTVLRHEEPDRNNFDVELELVDGLYRGEDVEEALVEAVHHGRQQERRRTLNKIRDKIQSLEGNIEESVHSRHELGNCHNKGGIDNLEELKEEE